MILTISMMVLLALLAVGLLSLSTVSLRSSQENAVRSVARANARMALNIAIGELQKALGPDRAVSAPASIMGESVPGRHWTGAWGRGDEGEELQPTWLVSGDAPNPEVPAGGDMIDLVRVSDPDGKVSVERVLVEGRGGQGGAMAYWIGDEGAKARVDIKAPEVDPAANTERLSRASSAQETNIAALGDAFERFSTDEALDRRSLITVGTLGLAMEDGGVDHEHFHDITTGGESLPVDVVDGGMKVDLSRVFESSRNSLRMFNSYFGATPTAASVSGAKFQRFSVSDAEKFYFVDEMTRDGSLAVGPNWGILYNYHRLWENLNGRGRGGVVGMSLLPVDPTPETDIRRNEWAPYTGHDEGRWKRDQQHHNSSVTPVISLLQMGFRLKTERISIPPAGGRGRPTIGYKVQVEFKPVVGIWNPYNVGITAAPYRFDWALYPYMRIGIGPSGSNWANRTPRVWMREHWLSEGLDPEDPANAWFRLETTPVDLQPGEFRLFSVDEQARMGQVNTLYPRWNEKGAFVFDVIDSDGQEIIVDPGYVVWIGDLFLEDGQHPETASKFPGIPDDVTASWFTLKSGSEICARVSDLWVPGTGSSSRSRVMIPEQVVSGWDGRRTTKDRRPVEELAEVHHHVATWSFGLRTSAMAEEGQTMRSYVDGNVRAVAANPVWDGSQVTGGRGLGLDGWNFISPLLGGSHPDAERGEVGDGGPPGRGLIAEAAVGDQTPQTPGGDRFQGYGGAVNTASGGHTHVVIFDVPRTPPVSIGQLQHAQLARYNYEPTFVLGNSYANPRVPLNNTYQDGFMGISGFRVADVSYLVNEEIWDRYFYSTLSTDYVGQTGRLDSIFGFSALATGERQLPNPRMRFRPLPGDESLDRLISEAGVRGAEAVSARIAVEGGFNVNSTSVDAWKAVLSSLSDFEFPVVDRETGEVSWESESPIRFARFGHVLSNEPYRKGQDGSATSFWQSFREIESEELDRLAQEIVAEVRTRGPFRSFAEFVNRDLDTSSGQFKGALQAALDRTINIDFPDTIGGPAENPQGAHFSDAVVDESEAAGNAAYVMQGDVLQALAPVLNVRSDYFRIRALGEARDASGKVIATARCEAFVQRRADRLDSTDPVYVRYEELQSEVNKSFGRRFEVVSFRWLSSDEA